MKRNEYEQKVLNKIDDDILAAINLEDYKRDIIKTKVFYQITKENDTNSRLKKTFFWIVCVIFAAVTILGCITITIVACKGEKGIEAITIVVSSLCTIISAILALPQIIAKHLFPEDEERIKYDFLSKAMENELDDFFDYDDETDDS